jgi:hypothetical protein
MDFLRDQGGKTDSLPEKPAQDAWHVWREISIYTFVDVCIVKGLDDDHWRVTAW